MCKDMFLTYPSSAHIVYTCVSLLGMEYGLVGLEGSKEQTLNAVFLLRYLSISMVACGV